VLLLSAAADEVDAYLTAAASFRVSVATAPTAAGLTVAPVVVAAVRIFAVLNLFIRLSMRLFNASPSVS
jgi:hypothetical protein